MENIAIKGYSGDFYIPSVHFNAQTGVCSMEGESYLEDTMAFFAPLLEWIERYTTEVKDTLLFNFKLNYFNTSSSKRILDILLKLKDYEKSGGKVVINWYFENGNRDVEEDVDDFTIISELEINKHFV